MHSDNLTQCTWVSSSVMGIPTIGSLALMSWTGLVCGLIAWESCATPGLQCWPAVLGWCCLSPMHILLFPSDLTSVWLDWDLKSLLASSIQWSLVVRGGTQLLELCEPLHIHARCCPTLFANGWSWGTMMSLMYHLLFRLPFTITNAVFSAPLIPPQNIMLQSPYAIFCCKQFSWCCFPIHLQTQGHLSMRLKQMCTPSENRAWLHWASLQCWCARLHCSLATLWWGVRACLITGCRALMPCWFKHLYIVALDIVCTPTGAAFYRAWCISDDVATWLWRVYILMNVSCLWVVTLGLHCKTCPWYFLFEYIYPAIS